MKIDDRRLFTYPVLAEGRDDYKSCKFSAEMKVSSGDANNFVLEINFSTDCAELKKLIEGGDAEYLLHVECPATIYREIETRSLENFSCNIPLSLIKEKLYPAIFIVLRRDIKNFSCKDWNEDFDWLSFDLQKGSVLAYQNFTPLSLPDDPNIFKNVSSIFSVCKRIKEKNKPFDVEMTSEKIKIFLTEKDFDLYSRYASRPEMQPILNTMIILPALTYVFEELKFEDVQDHSSDIWFMSLRASYRKKGLSFDKLLEDKNSLELAQEVMNLPITKSLESIAHIFDDAAEDL